MSEMKGESAIVVEGLYKSFNLPHEQSNGIKQLLVNKIKGNKGYEVQKILQDITFTINKGDFFGIVGRNGSGKSTLLKLLSGIYVPDMGVLSVTGSLTPFIELGVGFNPELTGRENVFLNGALLGFSRLEMHDMYDDIVSFAELPKFMDQKLKNYSSGMQVRLAFSIAIRADSDILILDEVLAVGDAAFQQKCFEYFEDLKRSNKTVILVTHDMDSVKRFCNRAMVISNGRMEAIGSPEEVADIYTRENLESTKNNHPLIATVTGSMVNVDSFAKDGFVKLKFKYECPKVEHYVGMSLISNGVSVGELNSRSYSLSVTSKSIVLTLNTTFLNPGPYEVGVALFDKKTNALIDFNNKAESFLIPGFDENRGGVLKLEGEWK